MRLFIAIPMDETMAKALLQTQEIFRMQGIKGNYTPRENMHLTLAFIGEYGDPDEVMDALENVSFRSFRIRLNQIGTFGDLWWAGIDESGPLKNLAAGVRHALSEAKIPYDRKRFKPHITLLRRVTFTRQAQPDRMLKPEASMLVDHFCLMCSTRGKHGMIYTEVGRIEMNDPA